MRTPALAALLVLAVAACTPVQWVRPAGDAAAALADEAECRAFAARRAWLYGYDDPFFERWRYVRGKDGRLYVVRDPFPRFALRRQFAEQNFMQDCMRDRGYRLLPVEPSPP